MENELSHIGVLGMRWGHRSGSGWKGNPNPIKRPFQKGDPASKKTSAKEVIETLGKQNRSDIDMKRLNRGRGLMEQIALSRQFQKKYAKDEFMLKAAIVHGGLTVMALQIVAAALTVAKYAAASAAAAAAVTKAASLAVAPFAGLALLASDEEGKEL